MANTDKENPEVWLYDAGAWHRAPDPIEWESGDDVHERYKEHGYTDYEGLPFIDLVYPGDVNCTAGLTLWVRAEAPECIIDIEGSHGTSRSVYVARFPDALDLMARWSPLVAVSVSMGPERRKALDEYYELEAARTKRQRPGGGG